MGLDISGYATMTKYVLERTDDLDADYEKRENEAYQYRQNYPEFARTEEGLEDEQWYDTATPKRIDIGHWTYSGWNVFRESLSEFQGIEDIREVWAELKAGKRSPDSVILHDIINFTDCDGAVGPKSVKRLAREFAYHKAAYLDWLETDDAVSDRHTAEWFRNSYLALTEGFAEVAEGGGFVVFR
jgi:hypothetical protein